MSEETTNDGVVNDQNDSSAGSSGEPKNPVGPASGLTDAQVRDLNKVFHSALSNQFDRFGKHLKEIIVKPEEQHPESKKIEGEDKSQGSQDIQMIRKELEELRIKNKQIEQEKQMEKVNSFLTSQLSRRNVQYVDDAVALLSNRFKIVNGKPATFDEYGMEQDPGQFLDQWLEERPGFVSPRKTQGAHVPGSDVKSSISTHSGQKETGESGSFKYTREFLVKALGPEKGNKTADTYGL